MTSSLIDNAVIARIGCFIHQGAILPFMLTSTNINALTYWNKRSSLVEILQGKGTTIHTLEWLHVSQCVTKSAILICLAKLGKFDLLKKAVKNGWELNIDVVYTAAKKGYIYIALWAIEHLLYIGDINNTHPCFTFIASCIGDLGLLIEFRSLGCFWHPEVCSIAAEKGYIDIIQYSHKNGCYWDYRVISKAAEGGHLNVIIYANSEYFDIDFYELMNIARYHKHEHILKWVYDNHFDSYLGNMATYYLS